MTDALTQAGRGANGGTARERTVKLLRALRLNRLAAKVYYRYVHGFASAGQELPEVVQRCLRRARDTGVAAAGDYYEFGIFKGHTFLHAQLAARRLGLSDMRFFGFDSFRGLPPPRGVDCTDDGHFYAGQYAWPRERVERELIRRGASFERAALIEGFFSDTLTAATRGRYSMGKASVVLLDADLYESAAAALEFVAGMLLDGTLLIMDDWNAFDRDDSRGERRALREFLAARPRWQAEPWFDYGAYGRVFTLRRSGKRAAHSPALMSKNASSSTGSGARLN